MKSRDVTQSRAGGNVDARQMQELPVNGRNWQDLALLHRASVWTPSCGVQLGLTGGERGRVGRRRKKT